jgi:hypothetical protein
MVNKNCLKGSQHGRVGSELACGLKLESRQGRLKLIIFLIWANPCIPKAINLGKNAIQSHLVTMYLELHTNVINVCNGLNVVSTHFSSVAKP